MKKKTYQNCRLSAGTAAAAPSATSVVSNLPHKERRASSRELREAKEVECRISGRTAADLMLLGLLGSALPALEAAQAQLMAPTVP